MSGVKCRVRISKIFDDFHLDGSTFQRKLNSSVQSIEAWTSGSNIQPLSAVHSFRYLRCLCGTDSNLRHADGPDQNESCSLDRGRRSHSLSERRQLGNLSTLVHSIQCSSNQSVPSMHNDFPFLCSGHISILHHGYSQHIDKEIALALIESAC
jgi:hypothetical protein